MTLCPYACGTADHVLSRRAFLGSAALAGLGAFTRPAIAHDLHRAQKRVLMIYLAGGSSQLETWDPKPGTNTGGPFRAIATSAVGIHVSELLPYTAKQMHRLALIRSVNTAEDEHGRGEYIANTGRRREPSIEYPHLGAVAAKLLGPADADLPGYIHITPGGGGQFNRQDAAFLGPRYASVALSDGHVPANLGRPKSLSVALDHQGDALRQQLDARFARSRRTAQTDAYTGSFEQAEKVMKRSSVFDLSRETPKAIEHYGHHDFGRHCLLARRLLEAGVTFVKITHTNYDTHHENFTFHLEQLGEFDRPFATLIDDLAQRGMLESTLVIVVAEFGRTPHINHLYGRDHWSKAWSVLVGGCGLAKGAVVGKTNANGTAITDREVNGGHLFHTYYRAVGLDPKKNFYPNNRPIPMADPKASAIKELLV